MKTVPNKISTEELLKALEGKESEQATAIQESLVFTNDVPLFLSKYDISPGEHKISKNMLYRLYCRFSAERVRRYEFSATLDLFLTIEAANIYVNKTPAEISTYIAQKSKAAWQKYSPAHPSTRKHFEEFLEGVELKAGNKWVQTFILKEIYNQWCRKERKTIRFKTKPFASMLKLYDIPNKRTEYVDNWFKIDESVLSYITPEEIRKLKDDRKPKKEKKK